MSFRDFDRGKTAAQIRQQTEQEVEYLRLQKQEQKNRELLQQFKESEHRLSILRTIHAGDQPTPEEALKRWLQSLNQDFNDFKRIRPTSARS